MTDLTKKMLKQERVRKCIFKNGYLPSLITDIEKEDYFPQWGITTYICTYNYCEYFFIAVPDDERKAVKYEPLNA